MKVQEIVRAARLLAKVEAEPPEELWSKIKAGLEGFCACGCGRKTTICGRNDTLAGMVKGQPRKFIMGHNNAIRENYKVLPNGCWEWLLKKDKLGYGQVCVHRRVMMAHIWMYEKTKGKVPEGLELDHTCENKACVNPDHLEPVTHTENVRRGKHTKITMEIAKQIRKDYATEEYSHSELADLYALNKSTISQILSWRSWR